jgi:UDP-N-acetylmuramate dehydrogenase
MMVAVQKPERLIDRLPSVRGRYSENAPLAKVTWFRVGGAAEVMFRPADTDDLAEFLRSRPPDVPVTVVGVASNLLVRDGGVPGVVVRLGRGFTEIAIEDGALRVGAGALDLNVAIAAREAEIAGLEFLSGIPGTIGGGVRMNAGAYGAEMKNVVRQARAIDEKGTVHTLDGAGLGFGYRRCAVPESWVFVEATLVGRRGTKTEIAARMAEIQASRESSQPIRNPTGGSTFANPPGAKAWELIDRAGCRGLRRGGAMVSEMHCNFLINTGDATAADLEGLGEEVRRRVFEKTGVRLEWEIRRVGVSLGPGFPGLAP